MIKPTVGRVVWYWQTKHSKDSGHQPQAAIVVLVISDTMVNLTVFSSLGDPYPETQVRLYQGEGEEPLLNYCEWMPYQIGQAAKTQALQDVADAVEGKAK